MNAIILAAGKGTRFASEKAKVLQEVAGKPLVVHVVEQAKALGAHEIVVVIGYQGEAVIKTLDRFSEIQFAWQREQLGTGHAVTMALPYLDNHIDDVLILYGDVPGVRLDTLQRLQEVHAAEKNIITLLTAVLENPHWYGRILKDKEGTVIAIREAKDASPEELPVREVNSGIMIIDGPFLQEALRKITRKNVQGEYYLTDIVEIAVREGKRVGAVQMADSDEMQGVNSVDELQKVEEIFARRGGK